MLNLKTILTGCIAITCGAFSTFSPARGASLLANSEIDFFLPPENSSWSYGYYDGSVFQATSLNPDWGEFTSSGGTLDGLDTPQWIVRQWQSNFNGIVSLSALMPKIDSANSGVDFKHNILVDGKSIFSQDSSASNGNSIYDLDRINVNVGSVIDFAFAPNSSNWSGKFDLIAKIKAHSGLIYVNDYPGSSTGHLGLLANGKVYEANPNTSKVQARSFDEFIQDLNAKSLSHEFIEFPELVAQALAKKIETKLGSGYLHQEFSSSDEPKGENGLFTNAGLIEWAAEEVKINGGQGFYADALEMMKFNGLTCANPSCSSLLPQNLIGRIKDHPTSYRTVNREYHSISFDDFDRKIQEVNNRIEYFLDFPIHSLPDVIKFPVSDWVFYLDVNRMEQLTPYELRLLMEPFKTGSLLQGGLDSVDFILTDPLGRKMGYTQEHGFFNSIPNVFYSSENLSGLADADAELAPLAQADSIAAIQQAFNERACSQNEEPGNSSDSNSEVDPVEVISQIFNFSILDRLDGEYKIQQIGRNKNSKSTIDDGTGTTITQSDSCRDIVIPPPPPGNNNPDVSVPEPSTILGLVVLGLLGVKIKKHRRSDRGN